MSLRPGGFSEYNPTDQKKFDLILKELQKTFSQHNYDHIYTPAVESVDILKKGGDIIDKQVYGLYGLAQGSTDTKDYALHFDLTIPLARYILDHRNDLTFPFRRYQMQPVWRGESTKRGRYKEFWQFDIDAIRPSATNIGSRYDVETIYIMDKAMQNICEKFDININRILKLSHIGLTKNFLKSEGLSDKDIIDILRILDNYYKLPFEVFCEKLSKITTINTYHIILELIKTKNHKLLSKYKDYEDLESIISGLLVLNIEFDFDICIVRGHNYYKGMVCEWFEKEDINYGSLAAGGRYDNITDFIDPRQSFSGVGTSLGRFVYLAVNKFKEIKKKEKYIFINFADTQEDIIKLYNIYIQSGKICEIYPTANKISKQFEYADRKDFTSAILLGSGEKELGIFKVKNLKTGLESMFNIDNH